MKKRYIIGLIICCLMIIPLVGCTTKKATTTGTTQTPLQALSTRVNSSDAVNSRQDQNITDLSNRITGVENRPQVDIAPLTARVGVLEGLNMSTFTTDLTFVKVRLASYDSYNISGRLTAIEAKLNASPTSTPLPNGSTPTPAPSTNHAPTILSLTTTPLTSGSNQSWIVTCTANDSDSDTLHYIWASTGGTLLYFAGNNSLLWSLSGVGNYSIVCQVNDGKDGYALGIKAVTY